MHSFERYEEYQDLMNSLLQDDRGLFHCIKNDDHLKFCLLMQSGINPNSRILGDASNLTIFGTLLSYTVQYDRTEMTRYLLDMGAKIDSKLLIFMDISEAMCELLIEYGVDVNDMPTYYPGHALTPLMYACQNVRPDIVALLLKHGANVNLQDNNGMTALHYITKNNGLTSARIVLISMLLAHGADKSIKDNNGLLARDMTLQEEIRSYLT